MRKNHFQRNQSVHVAVKSRVPATKPLLLSVLMIAAFPAVGQSAGTDGAEGRVQTIEVTARRVTERIIDVPLSITALSAKDLNERGITSIDQLAEFTPGLSYSPDYGRTAERPVIRGISALRPEAPQPVSIFVDGLFLRDGALAMVLDDAQRVEVIKGPQSALYGRSTYAGAINYVTVKPGNQLKGTVSVTAGEAGEASVFGAVTVPINDMFSLRVKGRHKDYDGQYTNTKTGNKIGGEKTDAYGVVLSFKPSDRFDATLSLDQSKVRDGYFNATVRTIPTQAGGVVTSQNGSTNVANGGACNGHTINIVGNNAVTGLPDASVKATASTLLNGWTCGPATFSGTSVTRNETDMANYTDPATGINYGNIAGLDREMTRTGLTMNYSLADGYTLTSQTGLTRQQTNLGADQSYNGVQFSVFGTPWLTYDRDHLDYVSQEFRVSSPEDRPLTWLAGMFYYDEQGDGITSGVIKKSGTAVVVDALLPKAGSAVRNVAPFGRVQYEYSKQLRVSMEGRYNRETIEVVGTPQGIAKVTAGTCVSGQQCIVQGNKTFTDFSPRLTVDYKLQKNTMIYGQLATGSKSGGFNTAAGTPVSAFSYDGEKVKSAEFGIKTLLADGLVALNAALFRNNIDGLQLSNLAAVTNPMSGLVTNTTIVNNVGSARTQGLELDTSVRASQWLTLSANYAYTDAKALKGTEVTSGTVFGGDMSVAGFTLPRSPKHSAAASAAVDVPLASGLYATGRIDVMYQSRRYAEIQNLVWADPYTHVNLSAGVRGKNWRATLWVKNATNDDTSLNGFRYVDPATFRRSAVDFLPRLRQVGVTASYDF
jgi:outer membrane receptor protein involved in Fe transport